MSRGRKRERFIEQAAMRIAASLSAVVVTPSANGDPWCLYDADDAAAEALKRAEALADAVLGPVAS